MRERRIAGALLSLVLSAGSGQAAEVPRLLADIDTTPAPLGSFAAPPAGFVSAGDRLLFSTASYYNSDDEGILWQTDGTASGTGAVSSSTCPFPCRSIVPLATWHGLALLKVSFGDDSAPQTRLWRSDGTAAGTFPLTDQLSNGDLEKLLRVVSPPSGGVFYFTGCLPEGGCLLWRSDGTRAGTAVLADGEFPTVNPHAFAFWSGKLYFLAGPGNGTGLWSTDGTPEGTKRLTDVAELDQFSGTIVPTPSHLFFSAGNTSEDLWVTDGTPEGARLVADFPALPCVPELLDCEQGDVSSLFAFGDSVLFIEHRPDNGTDIWRSDGTPGGTGPQAGVPIRISEIRRAGSRWLLLDDALSLRTASDDFSHVEPLTGCDGGDCPTVSWFFSTPGPAGALLFVGADAAHGMELWTTDATSGGTHRLSDACPGACSAFSTWTFQDALATVSSLAYFRALPSEGADPFQGDELWVTDGTAAGTHRVAGHVAGLGIAGGLACFGIVGEEGADSEIWTTDGSAAGTRRVTTLQRIAPGSQPLILKRRGGALLLASNGSGEEIWRSNGTPQGTLAVPGAELDGTRAIANAIVTQVGPLSFFSVSRSLAKPDTVSTELWRTDGTGPGTRGIASFGTRGILELQTAWGGKLLFLMRTGGTCAFWSSDGTSAGTREILPLSPGIECPTAASVLDGSRFFFVARVADPGGAVSQIFVSNGTPAGTRQLSAFGNFLHPYFGDAPAVAGGIAFFRIFGFRHDTEEVEIWRSDGTPAGTYRVFKDLGEASDFFGFRGFLYFTATTEPLGPRYLYRAAVRGTGAPVLLAQVAPSPLEVLNYFASGQITPVGGRLFFAGWDADAGNELWVTDGTPAGTHRVSDVRPGPGSSYPYSLAVAGSRVFFSAEDGEHGRELWESDGTPGGTHMVWDLNPGGFSSNPGGLLVSNGYLFFSADDGATGVEPWALRLEP
ncbi:MAG TPA: ELWxxDGT repeat protein [Thermoanaerobaculia bacterium]|nr:ELWxxDGT repeat protein [Thermoanaerobaculia bacterium]